MRVLIALLLLLAVAAEGAMLNLAWSELRAAWGGSWPMDPSFALLLASPLLVAVPAALAARALHRRGSALAWVVAGLPAAVVLAVLGLAVALTINPIRHQP